MAKLSWAKISRFVIVLLLLTGIVFKLMLNSVPVYAKDLGDRSIQLSSYVPSAVTDYFIQFVVPTTSTIGSIVFEFCTNSAVFTDACMAPSGLDVTNTAIASQTGNTGFSVDATDTTPNKLVIGRPAFAGAVINSTYDFTNIANPNTGGQSVYVRIATYASTDGSGAYNDRGAVAYVTASQFTIGAFVPPYLRLCVGLTVSADCSSASGDSLNLGTLSSKTASSAQSQFAAASNSPTGFAIYTLGTTMTAGNNVINANASPTVSLVGNNQFGINLRANSVPAVGANPSGPGIGSPNPNYNLQNFYMYQNGDQIASSPYPSDYSLMTVSYVVNVNSNQAPGIYSTTVTYVAIGQF